MSKDSDEKKAARKEFLRQHKEAKRKEKMRKVIKIVKPPKDKK